MGSIDGYVFTTHVDVPGMNTHNINEYTYAMGLKQTWEIGRFSRKIRRYMRKH